jgi:hypothetical protein
MRLYVGPDRQSRLLPGGAESVDVSTFIEELGSPTSATADQGVPNLPLWWQDRLNTAQLSTRELKTKKYRKDDDTTSRKRRRCDESASPVGHDTGSSQIEHDTGSYPADHDTCNGELTVHISELVMTDRDINHAFEDFETPVSECIIHRMAGIMQEQKGTYMLPPLDFVRRLRDPADLTISTDLLLWEISTSHGRRIDGSLTHLSRGDLEDAFGRQEELINRLRAWYTKQ